MKPLSFLKIAVIAMPFVMGSCKSSKTVEKSVEKVATDDVAQHQMIQKVSDNAQYAKFITSKVKFQVKVGAQDLTLTGNLKMKRDDVIRLQLMAFGFVEAGRLEFTKEIGRAHV